MNIESANERRVILSEFIDLINDIRRPRINCDNLTCLEIDDTNKPDDVCSICLNEFQCGETVCNLDCNHNFHKSCIAEWFDNHSTCPICKFEVSDR